MRVDDGIGFRVARWRDVAGQTQQQLADAVGVTREYISMIENGRRAVTKRSLLIDLASALHVSVGDLTMQATQPRTPEELVVYGIGPALRVALDEDPEVLTLRNLAHVGRDVDAVMAARMACDYGTVARLLPDLIVQTLLWSRSGGDDGRTGLALFVRAATTGASTVKSVGYADLAIRLSERAVEAARQLQAPAERAAAAFFLAQSVLNGGSRRRSYSLAANAAADLDRDAAAMGDNDCLAWYGLLNLHASLSAASLGRTVDAETHLVEAAAAANQVEGDPWRQEFSPANVGIWRVGITLENGAPEQAPQYARGVDRTQVRTKQRLARLHMDTARGLYAQGNSDAALRQFLTADTVAPQDVRTRPAVREIVSQMARDARRGGGDELRLLATRMGIDPAAPPDSAV